MFYPDSLAFVAPDFETTHSVHGLAKTLPGHDSFWSLSPDFWATLALGFPTFLLIAGGLVQIRSLYCNKPVRRRVRFPFATKLVCLMFDLLALSGPKLVVGQSLISTVSYKTM
jgi:hypothetical protein